MRGFLSAFDKLGVDQERILQDAGLTAQELEGPPRLVSVSVAERVCKSAIQQTGDDRMPLKAAMAVEPECFDLLGYLMRASDDLNQALTLMIQYERMLGSGAQFSLHPGGTYTSLRIDINGPAHVGPIPVQVLVVALVSLGKRVSDPHGQPAEVCFRQRRPDGAEALSHALGCRMRFDCPNDLILYGRNTLAQPLPRRDPRLRQILERQAQRMLEQLPEEQDLVQSLRRLIMSELPAGTASADRIARRAGMSVRTMARHLRAMGTSYQRVLDQVRYERACDFLRGPEVEVSDVAFRMGFSDASSFNRAFKRWSGVSPSTYRKESMS
ncbi:MAG: AraC family transcriptional regulator ligand-binding domain-containing protein [Myxococcales bacterium]|nr:AraC family transcriptional regulator ligand-binding domain-containing protein [Myxococcales bacterium]MDD9965540.1 AraC family transcriptional regulator ligand-binding domain-containing protein [Myxococcales bacterium]